MSTPQRLDLTDSEWMDVIDGDRDGLPRCCANVSALRDDLIFIARNGGVLSPLTNLRDHLKWVFPEHESTSVMDKVMTQLDIRPSGEAEHTPSRVEF